MALLKSELVLIKLKSGSLYLFRGVGRQRIIASNSLTFLKLSVAFRKFEFTKVFNFSHEICLI